MIDGIKLQYTIPNYEAWKDAVNLTLYSKVDISTGLCKEKVRHEEGVLQRTIVHSGSYQTYILTVKEIKKTPKNKSECSKTYYLTLQGSFHKNFFNGANYERFTWNDLQQELTQLQEGLKLTPTYTDIVNLEIGVNIRTSFNVIEFLQSNLISYKGVPFNRYTPDSNGVCLGYVCHLSQYSVKIYDKGLQNNLPYNLMRFELRFIKMQKIKKEGINTLLNLKDAGNVNGLMKLLFDAWDNVLLYDNTINLSPIKMKPNELEVLKNGSNPKFWERLKKTNLRNFNYKREQFKKLISIHGTGMHESIKARIQDEWAEHFGKCTNLPTV